MNLSKPFKSRTDLVFLIFPTTLLTGISLNPPETLTRRTVSGSHGPGTPVLPLLVWGGRPDTQINGSRWSSETKDVRRHEEPVGSTPSPHRTRRRDLPRPIFGTTGTPRLTSTRLKFSTPHTDESRSKGSYRTSWAPGPSFADTPSRWCLTGVIPSW